MTFQNEGVSSLVPNYLFLTGKQVFTLLRRYFNQCIRAKEIDIRSEVLILNHQ